MREMKSSVPDEGGCAVLPVNLTVGPVYVRHALCGPRVVADVSHVTTRLERKGTLRRIICAEPDCLA